MASALMIHHRAEPFGKTRIFRVFSPERGRFEVRADDDELLGSANDEIKAIWSAVLAADLVSELGYRVRVLVKRGDAFIEEYVAKPQLPAVETP
jgi:hypothetical protein